MLQPLLTKLGMLAGFFALFIGSATCNRPPATAETLRPPSSTLTVGFGLASGQGPESGLQQALSNISLEGLFSFSRDGRSTAWLAENWSVSGDGKEGRLRLREGVTFHDGTPVNASLIREVLSKELPRHLGPTFSNITSIEAPSEREVLVSLKARSNFLLESLGFPVQAPNASRTGTGAFSAAERKGNELEMLASPRYYGTRPFIDRILVKSYLSVRAAWADLLRGNLDMLYEVGVDALDSLEPSTATKVFTFPRPYAFMLVLNVQRAILRDPAFRRTLNSAIDREQIVRDVLGGRGTPADGPVSAQHWAYDESAPRFQFGGGDLPDFKRQKHFSVVYADPSLERLALMIQRQLQGVGVEVTLESGPLDQVLGRVQAGDFDAMLADAVNGPTMVRPSLWWHSRGPLNWGHYSSPAVDAALEAINRAPDDAAYKAGVGAFQRAIVDDPPAIFLAWSERARAVSTRFEVPVEPGRDILSTLRLWRPVGAPALAKN